MRKFDMDVYTTRRMKELRGEKVYGENPDSDITLYTRRRMREIQESLEAQRDLDKSLLGCYAIETMGDHDGES